MACIQSIATKTYRLGVWKIEEKTEELAALAGIPFLPGFKNEARVREHLAVRALASQMGIPVHSIAYLDNGKPYLTESDDTISISHTKGYAAILLSPLRHSGVDIEQRSDRVLRVRHKFMHRDELARMPQDESIQTDYLLLHWCAKESMFKALDTEGVDFAHDLRVEPFELTTNHHFQANAPRSGLNFRIDYFIEADYCLTCCTSEGSGSGTGTVTETVSLSL